MIYRTTIRGLATIRTSTRRVGAAFCVIILDGEGGWAFRGGATGSLAGARRTVPTAELLAFAPAPERICGAVKCKAVNRGFDLPWMAPGSATYDLRAQPSGGLRTRFRGAFRSRGLFGADAVHVQRVPCHVDEDPNKQV